MSASYSKNICGFKKEQRLKIQQGRLFHLSQKLDYGLFLLTKLTRSRTPLSIKKISKENNASFYFLQKIALDLKNSGIIEATRGKTGGYILKKRPRDISLREIVESLEGPITIVPCLRKMSDGGRETTSNTRISSKKNVLCKREPNCGMKPGMQKINAEIEALLLQKKLKFFIS